MTVSLDESGQVISVSGNTCPRGIKYAHQECTLPLRMITAVIPAEKSEIPLSVKTAEPLPKHLISEVMTQLRQVHVTAPVKMGQIILPNVCDTGIDIIATRPLS